MNTVMINDLLILQIQLKYLVIFVIIRKNYMIILKDKETVKRFNILAREQMKLKLLTDINIDLQICELEWYSKKEYIEDLRNLLNSIKI